MDKIEGIILAAGFSQRAQSYKMTLKLGEKTILGNCIESMYNICSKIFVVGGYKIQNLIPTVELYSKVDLVLNPRYEDGMYSSIKEGIKYIKAKRFFLIPGDYPVINRDVYQTMANIDDDIVIPTYNNNKGHPVLMKSHLIDEINKNSISSNLREFISSKNFTTIEVQDKGILLDIDTIEDYHNICNYIFQSHKSNIFI